jgi:hypothetical protein
MPDEHATLTCDVGMLTRPECRLKTRSRLAAV